ncbi:MAG TPA: lysoplasmalogenase [Anaerolineae bacterium]
MVASIWYPIPFLVLTVALLIRARERTPPDERQLWLWKPLSTALVISVGVLSLTRPADAYDPTYTTLMLIGLGLSFVGDVLLIPQNNTRTFIGGLVAFLLAHLAYVAAFVYLHASRGFEYQMITEIVNVGALTLAAAVVYRYLSPDLGSLRVPVVAYLLVISIMVHRALAIAFVHTGPVIQPILIVLGALLFYVSDLILAVDRFRFHGQLPRGKRWNLSAYYLGQLFIALSASFFA